MQVQRDVEDDADGEVDGCKHQLSDSTFPVLTLYVDEKAGKLTSSKKKEDVRPHDLIEIEEERSSSEGSRSAVEKRKMPSGRAGTDLEESCSGLQNGRVAREMVHASGAVKKRSFAKCVMLSTEKQDACQEREETGTDGHQVDRSSTSSDDSCKNRMMEILEDAFKLDLAPKVSDLMAEYCDSAQGSTAAQESFDIDFQSYHGDDPEPEDQEDVDPVKWVGDGRRNKDGAEERSPKGDTQEDDDGNGFEPGEIEIDGLMLKAAGSTSEDCEDDRNFIKEGRYVDVQKMLTANLEMVFPETSGHSLTSPFDLNKDAESRKHQEVGHEEGDVTAGSSLYHVSALNEAAFLSDLSLEVNVDESIKSSLESVPQPQENEDGDDDGRDEEGEEEDEFLGNTPLHSALANAPPLSIPNEMDPDDSWLWPASGDDDTPFEEHLLRSMEVIGLDDNEGDDGVKRAERGRGDADKQLAGNVCLCLLQ
eukprot:XP_011671076.1 PREDICTED: uncharacterized protein LOC105441564 [Strongylocentrotus purpuratus]